MEKVLDNVRFTLKNDTEENWKKAVNFIPKKGEPIIYNKDAGHNYSRIKIGDGITKVSNLPFSDIDNVAKLNADNIFAGTNTFNGGVIIGKTGGIAFTETGTAQFNKDVILQDNNIIAYGNVKFDNASSVSVPTPTADSQAATKKYVDDLVCVSNTEPTNSNVSIWVDIS